MAIDTYISNNLSAYIRWEAYKQNVNLDSLADEIGIDRGKFNKMFDHHLKLKKDDLILNILSSLNLKTSNVFRRNLYFERIRNQFFQAFFFCLNEKNCLYEKIIEYQENIRLSPYYIDTLMIQFVYTVSLAKDYKKMERLSNEIKSILPSLSTYYKKFYYVYLMNYLDNTCQYKDILSIIQITKDLLNYDIHLEGRLYYFCLSIYRSLGYLDKAKSSYFQASKYLGEVHNIAMLENLNLKYSGLLRISGEIQAALKNDLKLLEDYTVKQYRLRNIEILYNNIAWTYSLLHDYKKAVLYYQKALETLNDNDVYFNIAFCCYRIGEEPMASNYVQLGKKAPSCGDYIYLLLDWLELMIQDRYSHKTMQVLQNILRNYESDLEEIDKDTIQIEIVNYYFYNRMYEEAIHALQPLMGKQLISPSELIFTKKNENRHDLLFSEDELTLRSQMMESDNLFFEDDELGEDEWEELDDSFSRFTHN